jgi:hypothetical protein
MLAELITHLFAGAVILVLGFACVMSSVMVGEKKERQRRRISDYYDNPMYAVKIPFDDDLDDMLYVTEGDSKFHLRPLLFNNKTDAEKHAALWGDKAVVVQYEGDELL